MSRSMRDYSDVTSCIAWLVRKYEKVAAMFSVSAGRLCGYYGRLKNARPSFFYQFQLQYQFLVGRELLAEMYRGPR